jgi:hypothetical protein
MNLTPTDLKSIHRYSSEHRELLAKSEEVSSIGV